MTAIPPNLTNRSIAGYRCIARIAAGSFGTIWKAEKQGSTNKTVVIKIMNPEMAVSRQALGIFQKEYKLCHKLNHPCVLQYFDYGVWESLPYMVLEYFDSVNLKIVIQKEASFPIRGKIEIMIEHIAQAVDYIHEHGIIHRDIKPENILVNENGDVRLIDFSIAITGLSTWLPFLRKVEGSPSYMSPEQIQKRRLTSASDIYAFGISIYELLTERLPFIGKNQNEILTMHLKSNPQPPSKFNPDLTPGLDKLILSMLAKDPNKRPHDLKAFLRQLKRVHLFRVP